MATLEDAAQELVVKLRGLDSEIEESEHQLEELHQRIDTVAGEVDHEWTALTEAVTAFRHKVEEEQQRLSQHVDQAGQALSDAQQAVAEDGAEARSGIAEGHGRIEALAQHASGLEPGVESLAGEAGEAPAKSLADQAHEMEQQLGTLVEQARTFVHDEALPAVNQLAGDVHDHCQELHTLLAETIPAALQQAFDEWDAQIDGLEAHVATDGFNASHQHARDCVDYALDQCHAAAGQRLDDLTQVVGLLTAQLQELVGQAQQSAEALVAQAGAELNQELERVGTAAADAVAALDRVKQTLAQYSFVEV